MSRTLTPCTSCLLITLASLWGLVVNNSTVRAETLRVGAAQVDITPELGTPMAGYYYARASEGVHDPLLAKAIVLESGDTKVAIVGLDLISTTHDMVETARRLITEHTGIPGECVMISATHAHTGPIFARASRRYESHGGQDPLAVRYTVKLPELIAESVQQANEALRDARTFAATGRESSIAFNRRFHMRDGSIGWNPGKLNPQIVKPAGPIDDRLPFVFFQGSNDESIATFVNYTVHLDNVGGAEFSADLPFTVADSLARVLGKNMVTLYTSGTCGDINHIDVNWSRPQKGHENAARMGLILAAEILRQWPKLTEVKGPLQVRRQEVLLPLPEVTPEDVTAAEASIAKLAARQNSRTEFLEVVHAFKVMDVVERKGEPWRVEVQVITLGDQLAWVSLPGEIFVELGLAIKLDSPFPQTMIAELANGSIGYIPHRRAYSQGNYEVISARCDIGSGELLVEAAVEMLKEMYRISAVGR